MVTFVAGLPCSGKSTYIKNNFKNKKVIDIFEYQKIPFLTVTDIINGYNKAKLDLLNSALEEDVIMEHTLLKKCRRLEQIENLRNGGYTGEIHLIYFIPEEQTLKERALLRGFKENEVKDFIEANVNVLEIPDETEGFTSLTIIKE